MDRMTSRIADYLREGRGGLPGRAAGIGGPQHPTGLASVDWKTAVRDFIIERPGIALGAALAAGVTLGWLIKRR